MVTTRHNHPTWAGTRAALMQLIADRLRQQAMADGDDDGSLRYYAVALDHMAASLIVGADFTSSPRFDDDEIPYLLH